MMIVNQTLQTIHMEVLFHKVVAHRAAHLMSLSCPKLDDTVENTTEKNHGIDQLSKVFKDMEEQLMSLSIPKVRKELSDIKESKPAFHKLFKVLNKKNKSLLTITIQSDPYLSIIASFLYKNEDMLSEVESKKKQQLMSLSIPELISIRETLDHIVNLDEELLFEVERERCNGLISQINQTGYKCRFESCLEEAIVMANISNVRESIECKRYESSVINGQKLVSFKDEQEREILNTNQLKVLLVAHNEMWNQWFTEWEDSCKPGSDIYRYKEDVDEVEIRRDVIKKILNDVGIDMREDDDFSEEETVDSDFNDYSEDDGVIDSDSNYDSEQEAAIDGDFNFDSEEEDDMFKERKQMEDSVFKKLRDALMKKHEENSHGEIQSQVHSLSMNIDPIIITIALLTKISVMVTIALLNTYQRMFKRS